jgi:hypothetical protein
VCGLKFKDACNGDNFKNLLSNQLWNKLSNQLWNAIVIDMKQHCDMKFCSNESP